MSKLANLLNNLIDLTQRLPLLKLLPVNFYRFFVVGVTVFVIDYTFFNIFFFALGLQTKFTLINITDDIALAFSLANMCSVAISTVVGYQLNKHWSFENDSDNVATQFSKYVAVALFNNIFNNVFFGILFYEVFAESALVNVRVTATVSKVLSTAFQAITSYIAYKYVVFRDEKEVISEAMVP